MKIIVLFITGFLLFPAISSASLIGDSVSVDRRFNSIILSSKTVTVSSGIEIINWENLYIDFYDYGVKLTPVSGTGYSPVDFNGFDFHDLNFGSAHEYISSISPYFVSILDGSITPFDSSRISYTEHDFSLNMAGSGFGSSPLYIDIVTKVNNVSEPTILIIFIFGALAISLSTKVSATKRHT